MKKLYMFETTITAPTNAKTTYLCLDKKRLEAEVVGSLEMGWTATPIVKSKVRYCTTPNTDLVVAY